MRESSEFLKAVAKNWRTPKEREQLATEMRRKDAILDRKIQHNKRWVSDTNSEISGKIANDLEPVVHAARRRGDISGGARKILTSFSSH